MKDDREIKTENNLDPENVGDIYNRLEFLLQNKNLSKRKLADMIDSPYSTVVSIFANQSRGFNFDMLSKIAQTLNVSIDWLVTGKAPEQQKDAEWMSGVVRAYMHGGAVELLLETYGISRVGGGTENNREEVIYLGGAECSKSYYLTDQQSRRFYDFCHTTFDNTVNIIIAALEALSTEIENV